MSDIFISYSSDDKERVRPLVRLLEQQGWSIWWDRKIRPGQIFDQVIEQAITEARCVLVIWSRHSVASNWVKTEADEGVSQNKLIPVLMDQVPIPLEFRRIQAANLTDWPPRAESSEFQILLDSIRGMLGESASGRATLVPQEISPRRKPEPVSPSAGLPAAGMPKRGAFFIICGVLAVWLLASMMLHWDWPGMNIFTIPLVTIVLCFAAPVQPGTAAATVLGLHIFNLLMLLASGAVHDVEQAMELQDWLIFAGITLVNAIIVGVVCRSRLKN